MAEKATRPAVSARRTTNGTKPPAAGHCSSSPEDAPETGTVQARLRDAARRISTEAAAGPPSPGARSFEPATPPPPPPPLAPGHAPLASWAAPAPPRPAPLAPAREPGGRRVALFVALGVAVLGAIVALLVMLLGGGDDETAAPATTTAPPAVNTTVAPAATTTAPAPVTTIPSAAADRQRAQRIVLTLAALPGYENEPSSGDESDPAYEAALTACFSNNPLLGQFAKGQPARGVEGNEFRRPSGEYAVGSGVYFAESGDLARAAIRDAGGATVAQCITRAERAADTDSPGWTTVSVTTTRLPALSAGEENVGYRTGTVVRFHNPPAIDVEFVYSFTLVRVERAVIVLYDHSIDQRIPEAERARLANLLATRAAAA